MLRINLIRGMEKEVGRQQGIAYYRRWRQGNLEQARSYDRKRGERPRSAAAMERRRQKSKVRGHRWYQNNKERNASRSKKWRENNRERTRELGRIAYRRNHTAALKRVRHYRASHLEQGRSSARLWKKNNPERAKANKLRWEREHPGKVAAQRHRSYERHKEKHRPSLREYRKKNASKIAAFVKAWKRLNPAKIAIYHGRRRARKHAAIGSHTQEQWFARVVFYAWKCVYCGKLLTITTLRKDHRIPLSRGGTNYPANIVPSCGSCNSRKNTKTPREFAAVQ